MIDLSELNDYLLSLPDSQVDHRFGDDLATYFVGDNQDRLFALVEIAKSPLRLSLVCDPTLAKVLRQKYESVMPGHNLNKKHWNTIILSGQIDWQQIKDLIRHSYDFSGQLKLK